MAKQYAKLTVVPGEEPPGEARESVRIPLQFDQATISRILCSVVKDLAEIFVASIKGAQASPLVSV